MRLINLTQHLGTEDQYKDGMIELSKEAKAELIPLLNFEEIPTKEEMLYRAYTLISKAIINQPDNDGFVIGGAGYFMPYLISWANKFNRKCYFSFTKRMSEEKVINGSVVKTQVFKHLGWVEATLP